MAAVAFVVMAASVVVGGQPDPASAELPVGFEMTTIVSGLDSPTAVDVAANGAIFVTEKRGQVLRYDGLTDTTPTMVADRRTQTHNNRDRGMTGLAVHPQYPAVPWVYVAYTLDRLPSGGTIPAYGTAGGDSDPCPDADTTGCPALSRVVRFDGTTANATEQVLFEGHCQQFAYHTVGDLVFESATSLLVSFGDGSTGSFVEYGQRGNLCADPPGPAGTNLSAPTTEGGQARSQDILTRTDPTGVHGSVLRVDPNTFAPKAENPLAGDPEPTVASMVGTGFRNPFRLARDSANGRIYVGNVGGAGSEEINLIEGAGLFNSGWPCYEGTGLTQNSFWLTTNICNTLINSGQHDAPLFRYGRNVPIVSGEPCPSGGLSISGVAVNRVGFGPAALDGALFFTDYTRDCIWYLPQGGNGQPNAATPALFSSGVGGLVDLSFGPDGAMWAVDIIGGRVLRFTENAGNRGPTASFTATPSQGAPPLTVTFNASASADPDGDPLTYQWDFDGNGAFDATGSNATHTYTTAGSFQARLAGHRPGWAERLGADDDPGRGVRRDHHRRRTGRRPDLQGRCRRASPSVGDLRQRGGGRLVRLHLGARHRPLRSECARRLPRPRTGDGAWRSGQLRHAGPRVPVLRPGNPHRRPAGCSAGRHHSSDRLSHREPHRRHRAVGPECAGRLGC